MDVDLVRDEFTIWHVQTRGIFPGHDVVDALTEGRMKGTLPEFRFPVSPRRSSSSKA